MWLLALLGCEQSEEVTFSQFNQVDDHLIVSIGSETLPDVDATLYSSTGVVEVGTASISPGGGPVTIATDAASPAGVRLASPRAFPG